jgi:membrane associated rhomboid family serine protease
MIGSSSSLHSTTATRKTSIGTRNPYALAFVGQSGRQSHRRQEGTKLYRKWGPRWNPRPNSEYYKRDYENEDIFGGKIDFSSSYLRRRRKSKYVATFQNNGKAVVSLQRMLVILNVVLFTHQIFSAISYLPVLNSVLRKTNYPHGYLEPFDILEQYILGIPPIMIESKSVSFPFLQQSGAGSNLLRNRAYGQALIAATSLGPFTMDFVHQRLLTRLQPHRYLTSGFIHGSLVHLFFNMYYLWKLPRWVEDNGGSGNSLGGWVLYLFTYLTCIVMGNVVRDYMSSTSIGYSVSTLCLGASGGICGLNGLMFAMLKKMGNRSESVAVLKNMFFLLLFGQLMDGVSNASHVGGFVWGVIVGWLFGPNYQKTGYSSWKLSRDKNEPSLEYKRVMGSGVHPDSGFVPLRYGWGVLSLFFLLRPEWRAVPECIVRAFQSPGVLSGIIV